MMWRKFISLAFHRICAGHLSIFPPDTGEKNEGCHTQLMWIILDETRSFSTRNALKPYILVSWRLGAYLGG